MSMYVFLSGKVAIDGDKLPRTAIPHPTMEGNTNPATFLYFRDVLCLITGVFILQQ